MICNIALSYNQIISKPLHISFQFPPHFLIHAAPNKEATTNSIDDHELDKRRLLKIQHASVKLDDLYSAPPVIHDEEQALSESNNNNISNPSSSFKSEYFWLAFCFFGIMGSFVCYGLLLEYATSGGKHLHELSFLFVTSLLYSMVGWSGRYIRAEKPSTIPPAQFAVLGMTSMGSTFFSVRALRYVIYPIQVSFVESGDGVEQHVGKAFHHYKLATIGGDEKARHNLGLIEAYNRDYDIAMKHFMIAARSGNEESLKAVGAGYKQKHVTKDEYAMTLRAHQHSCDEMKSEQRMKATKLSDQLKNSGTV